MIHSSRFNKFITRKTIESGVWVDAPNTLAIVEPRQYPKSVMVWGGTCAWQKTFGFLEGVKINQKVYQRDIIEAVVLPWDQKHFENANWTLQQDSAPVFKSKKTQEWFKENFPDIISKECDHLLAGSQSHGLQCMVHFKVQGLHETAQNFRLSKSITSAGIGYIKGKRLEVHC
ncbi:DDE_3 domain-containing protein [Trichonephila clavipes]|nr:DDE_3 domain-containing protein [Trichonephila clavipes]